ALETTLNSATVGALSNATARIAGRFVDGIYDSAYINRLDMASSGPAFTCVSDDLPTGTAYGSTVSITYKGTTTAYTVAAVQPDGAGMTVLLLK
ncbi:MAG: hypothetical protein MUF16_04965, partial [Burkholderiaceae bacterium]|nr:hypothetical protein [Burkholderiaceae bacterium]